jgi:multiple sugar transport system permease protein
MPFFRNLRQKIKRNSQQSSISLILGVYLLGVSLLVFLPAAWSFGLAFFQFDGLTPPRWNGGVNFILAYSDQLFSLSVRNSLALIILPAPVRVLGALLAARLMQRRGRWIGWLRSAVFLPSAIPVAAMAAAGLWIFNPLYGPVNLLLQQLGLSPPAWFVEPLWAKPALILLSFWSIGEGFLVCLAALQDIPSEIDEAARVDGAGLGRIFVSITLPVVAPTLALLAFRDMILSFHNSFIAIFFTTAGGPYYATFTVTQLIYEQAFDLLSFGTASATLWALYTLSGLLVIGLYVIIRTWNIGITDEPFIL